MEKYDLKKSKAYEEIKKEGFPKMKVSEKEIRININATDQWFNQNYNQKGEIQMNKKKRKLKKWVSNTLWGLAVIIPYEFILIYSILQYCAV